MPQNLQLKKMKLKHSDVQVRTRGDMTALPRKDKTQIHIYMNIHEAPAR